MTTETPSLPASLTGGSFASWFKAGADGAFLLSDKGAASIASLGFLFFLAFCFFVFLFFCHLRSILNADRLVGKI